jgi:oleate hydratase
MRKTWSTGEQAGPTAEGWVSLGSAGAIIPEAVVFTVEYSVRSAQTAVYSLLGIKKEVSPLYKGQHDIKVLFDSVKTLVH